MRRVVYVEDEIESAAMDVRETTADGTPFLKTLINNFIGPGQVWFFLAIQNGRYQKIPRGQTLDCG